MSKRTQLAWVRGLLSLGAAAFVVVTSLPATAATTSDEPASVLVYAKIVVDTSGEWGPPTDTLLTLTSNVDDDVLKQAHCYYVNATGSCEGSPQEECRTSADCTNPVRCIPNWVETDFNIFITPNQPIAWYASEGLQRGDFPIEGFGFCVTGGGQQTNQPCFNNAMCGTGNLCQIGPNGLNNLGSSIPPVSDDPFIGSLTCVQFDPNVNPPVPDKSATADALTGDASIIAVDPNTVKAVDVAEYNAIGFRTVPGGNTDGTLRLGGPMDTDEYQGCANVLILDHFFDGATDPMTVGQGTNSSNGVFTTELTLVPCGNDFSTITPGTAIAQMLVFNEFEQRFSTSALVDCFYNKRISNIDTPNSSRSIFSAGVSGTIAGQTRIQGVGSSPTGSGLTGVAQLFVGTVLTGTDPRCLGGRLCSSAAYSLNQAGTRTTVDLLTIP
jgi:hypothetical protein